MKPNAYLRDREDRAPDERCRKCLRLYKVQKEGEGEMQELDELDIEQLIGDEPSAPTR